jgi:hypothetical protein
MLIGGVIACFLPLLWVLKLALLYVGLPYFVYTRVYLFYLKKWHYAKQTDKGVVAAHAYPIIGNLFLLLGDKIISKKTGDNYHPGFRITRDLIGPDMKISNASFFVGHEIYLLIGDLKAV